MDRARRRDPRAVRACGLLVAKLAASNDVGAMPSDSFYSKSQNYDGAMAK